MSKKNVIIFAILALFGLYLIASYNSLVAGSQQAQASWAQVQNVYQRRLDLIPNLVNTVKGYAAHERSTFLAVTQARAQATSTQNILQSTALPDSEKLQQFDQAQAALGSALGRLLLVVERYPNLKANQNFAALQAELAGTENRISVERRRFNEVVQDYNMRVQRFPGMLIAKLFNFKPIPYFQAAANAATAPVVSF